MRHVVFPLHPATPEEGVALEDLFAGRYDVAALVARLKQVAAELDLPFGDRSHTYNSRRAQELGKWAEQQGQGEAFRDAVYRAYFADGRNIARVEVLTSIAEEIGLDAADAEQVLRVGNLAEAVDADWQRARNAGVTAVPTVRYGSRHLVGFHPYADYRQLVAG